MIRLPQSKNEQDDQSKLIKHGMKLEELFNKRISGISKLKSHFKVAVLLLSWAVEHRDQLDTSEEIQDLANVFRDEYNFTVWERTMSSHNGHPKHQLSKFLAEFLYEFDMKDTLLIIYYGGHGRRDLEDGDLRFFQINPSKENENLTEIVWAQAASQLKGIDADRLLIFDCCHAGILERTEPGPKEHSMYEFIGSTPFNKTAIGPGEKSFTRALVISLRKLSTNMSGFSTAELLREIKMSKAFFELGQQPVSSELSPYARFYKIQIRPLSVASSGAAAQMRLDSDQVHTFPCSLSLTYTFSQMPTEAHIAAMTDSIQHLVLQQDIPIQQVSWIEFRKRCLRDCVNAVLSNHRASMSSSRPSELMPTGSSHETPSLSLTTIPQTGISDQLKVISLPPQTSIMRRATGTIADNGESLQVHYVYSPQCWHTASAVLTICLLSVLLLPAILPPTLDFLPFRNT